MKLILLAGNSSSNKTWIEKVENILKPFFEETRIQYYKHWSSGAELIDFDDELLALQNLVSDFSEYIIFAKSAGALLALKGVKEGAIKPSKCIFAGTAINWGKANNFDVDAWLNKYSVPTLFIQKTSDPTCSYQELEMILKDRNITNFNIKEITGDDHSYDDMEMLKEEVASFIS